MSDVDEFIDMFNDGGEEAKHSITTFFDSRDSKTYKKVTIGRQTWMVENLKYDLGGEKSDNKREYGYLYTWDDAKMACPAGWHLPNDEEWEELKNSPTWESVSFVVAETGFNLWWSATESDRNKKEANYWYIISDKKLEKPSCQGKTARLCVRCVED